MSQLLLGVLLAALIAAAAWRLGALTASGAGAAAVVGAAVFGLGGWGPAVLLVVFFASSSALTRVGRERKASMQAMVVKGGRRDWLQVGANGGLAAMLAVLYGVQAEAAYLAALVGALAAATADTWATEIGVLSGDRPRLLTTGRMIEPGASGGVTWLGLLASLLGGGVIGGVGWLLSGQPPLLLAGAAGGLGGSLLDSLLGATLQVQYRCLNCGRSTEQHPQHSSCGGRTQQQTGVRWLDNDVVNLAATVVGAILAWFIWLLA